MDQPETRPQAVQPIHSVTFPVTDVPMNTKLLEGRPGSDVKLLNTGFRPVEATSMRYLPNIMRGFNHPLLNSVHRAFAEHYPLTLSPDHIWLLICQGFARHIKANVEALRPLFVRHEGKIVLEIVRPDFVKGSPDNRWEEVVADFSRQIRGHLIGNIHDVLTADFSTTGVEERAAFGIVIMDAMQGYFAYAMSLCGIPSITLEGSPDDWSDILERTRALAAYGLEWWVDRLIPILEQLLRTSEGQIDTAFWENIYKDESKSGGPFVTGWLVNFFPYTESLKDGTQAVQLVRNPDWGDEITNPNSRFTATGAGHGLSFAPFKWDCGMHTYNMEFAAGFMGMTQDETTLSLRPYIGWAVCEAETKS